MLGAGASASCGIPVAKDILREAMSSLVKRDSSNAGLVHRLVRYLYPSFDENIRNYPNIEDFLNLVEMAKQFNTEEYIESTLWPKERLEEVIDITLRAVVDCIWSLMNNDQHVIQEFVRKNLRPGDTVITFNYDLTLERALEEHPGYFLYGYRAQRPKKRLCLLKPHGSIDWFEKRKLRGLRCEKDVESLSDELCYYPYFDFGKHRDLAEIPPVIVPPVSIKAVQQNFMKRTWRGLYNAVSDATELHVIGYSLPREDQFARLVLRRALRTNILRANRGKKPPVKMFVINPDEAVEQTFRRLVGRNIEKFYFYQAYFQDVAQDYNSWAREFS